MAKSNYPARSYFILGAGHAGRSIAAEIAEKPILGSVEAFWDDDPEKIGQNIDGLPVFGPVKNLPRVGPRGIRDEAIIAMPSCPPDRIREIYDIALEAGFTRIRILPGISQILEGSAHLIQTREISAEDILGRPPVAINLKESLAYLRGKRVMITGAGGSIGGELARQLLSGGAQRLYIFDHSENAIYEIDRELRALQAAGVGEKATVVPVVGELQDREYVEFILKRLKADVIFHAAAYKHVPMMEHNPVEAIKNNVFGTKNLVEAARRAGTGRFVLISTDKAVNPSSVYGASKFLAEEIVLAENSRNGDSAYMVVRFGNVLGSRGSIMPLFREQIARGGPVTITHPKASRFFMTIPEAVSLVLKAGGVGSSGTLYILDMGDPILIRDLAEQMIRFYGFEPDKDIPITYVGLRPGEKVHEALWLPDETVESTDYPRINVLRRKYRLNGVLPELLDRLEGCCFFRTDRPDYYRNRIKLKTVLGDFIPSIPVPGDEPEY
jgi:FlaA1/EpsC-like NDP-sugar epimerase